jgi:hypothetical protein
MIEMLGSTDRRAFNPARDVARLITPLSAESIRSWETQTGPAAIVRSSLQVSPEEFAAMATAYQKLFERLLDISNSPLTLGEAMKLSGFDSTSHAAQAVFFTRLGQLFFSAAYCGILDIQNVEDSICNDEDMIRNAVDQLKRPGIWARIRKAVGL